MMLNDEKVHLAKEPEETAPVPNQAYGRIKWMDGVNYHMAYRGFGVEQTESSVMLYMLSSCESLQHSVSFMVLGSELEIDAAKRLREDLDAAINLAETSQKSAGMVK